MSQQPKSPASYSGEVDVAGEKVSVANGEAEVRGEKYYVSADGNMVADKQGRLVGFIENGQFKKNTNEHLKMLLDKGLIRDDPK